MKPLANDRFLALLSLLSALHFAIFSGYFPLAIILTPYGDMLDWLSLYYNFPDQNLWKYLWEPHNGHRIIFTKLLMIGDAKLFSGLIYPVALLSMFCWLLIAGLALVGIRGSVVNPSTRQWVTVMMVLLLFPTSSLVNYAYAVNSQFVMVSFFAFIALFLLAYSTLISAERKSLRNTCFALSLIAASCASLSSLNGLIIWPILVWVTWKLRFGHVYIVVIGAMCGLFASVLVYSYPAASHSTQLIPDFSDIVGIVIYLIEYHGMPWLEVSLLYWPSMVLGAAILWLSVFYSVKGVLFSPALTPHAVVALAMLVFSLATAVVIAIGRHNMGLLPAHRYGIFLVMTHVSLFVLNIHQFERWMCNARLRSTLHWLTLIFAVGYLGQQVAVGQFALERAKAFAHYEKDILDGRRDLVGRKAIYFPNADKIEDYYRTLEEQQIYMFRPGDE